MNKEKVSLKQKYFNFVDNHISFIKNEKARRFFIPVTSLFIIVVLLAVGLDSTGIMGNSVFDGSCQDGYDKVKGYCVKTEYVSSILMGDVNLDNKIDSSDYITIKAYLDQKIKLSENQMIAADVNLNNSVDSEDYEIILSYVEQNEFYVNNANTNAAMSSLTVNIGVDRKCPNATKVDDVDISYLYNQKTMQCEKRSRMNVQKDSLNFALKYNGNDGKIIPTNSMNEITINNFDQNLELAENKYYKNDYVFNGWTAKNLTNNKVFCNKNSSKTAGKWVDINDSSDKLVSRNNCKYGKYVFKDKESFSQLIVPNQSVEMNAVWQKNMFSTFKNALTVNADVDNVAKIVDVGGYKAIRLLYGNPYKATRSGNPYSYIVQDIHVKNDTIYLSQDYWYNRTTRITKIPIYQNASKDDFKVVACNVGRCGHGIFDINGDEIFLSCDKKSFSENVDYGTAIYKIKLSDAFLSERISLKSEEDKVASDSTYQNKIVGVRDGIKKHLENVKLDEKTKKAVFRGSFQAKDNDPVESPEDMGYIHYYIYKFNPNTNKIGKEMINNFKHSKIDADFQGYDVDGNYLYVFHGDSKELEENKKYTLVRGYIYVYNINTGALVKETKLYENYYEKGKEIFMEGEGIAVDGENVYVSIAMAGIGDTDEGFQRFANNKESDSAWLKYVLVYKVNKATLYK